jgi:integrase
MPEISIGRLRGGYCAYWYIDGKRTRHRLKAQSREAAGPEALDLYRRHTFAPGLHTVADIWEAYRTDLGDKPTAKTMGYTGKAILPHFGQYRPDQVTRDMCRDYDRTRRAAGISQGFVHTELGHLRSALKFGQDVRMIDRAPAIWRPEKPQSDMRILTPEEMNRLVDGCHDPHVRLAVILLLGTAARVGAILDLTWDRVDIERGVINLRLDDSQTRKGRAVLPMNRSTRAALASARDAALTDYVIEFKGGPIKCIRKGFTAALKRSGIGHMRIHDCRHTAAVTMLAAGVAMEKVAQVLGHSNTATTERVYGRFRPEHMQDAVNVLDFVKARGVFA